MKERETALFASFSNLIVHTAMTCGENWGHIYVVLLTLVALILTVSAIYSDRGDDGPGTRVLTDTAAVISLIGLSLVSLYLIIKRWGKKVCGIEVEKVVKWIDECGGLRYLFLGGLVLSTAIVTINYHDTWVSEMDEQVTGSRKNFEKYQDGAKKANMYTLIAGTTISVAAYATHRNCS